MNLICFVLLDPAPTAIYTYRHPLSLPYALPIWLHDLVLARGAVIDPVQALAPPLQADAADHRLAHHLRRLGHLMVEGIEREEVLALGFRRKEARQVAVAVVPLDPGAAGRQPVHPVLRPPRPFPASAPDQPGPDSSNQRQVQAAEHTKTPT